MMREGLTESPINRLPLVVWLLAGPMIAAEATIAAGHAGLIGGREGIGLRLDLMERTAFAPEMLAAMWQRGMPVPDQLLRLLTYSFVQVSALQALFVIAFTLALGKMVAGAFRPWAVLALFLGSAAGGAIVFTLIAAALDGPAPPLVGGYPGVYGLVGAFTFLLWARIGAEGGNRARAFTLIGALLAFQLLFGLIAGAPGMGWIAEIAGFFVGFAMSFVLIDGGPARVLRRIRQR